MWRFTIIQIFHTNMALYISIEFINILILYYDCQLTKTALQFKHNNSKIGFCST